MRTIYIYLRNNFFYTSKNSRFEFQ